VVVVMVMIVAELIVVVVVVVLALHCRCSPLAGLLHERPQHARTHFPIVLPPRIQRGLDTPAC
jgi:hypothetical protein